MILLKQMIVFFLIMLIGYFLAKKDILDDKTTGKLTWMVVNVLNPALIISGALGENNISGQVVRQTIWVAVGMYACLIALGRLTPYALLKRDAKVYELMLVFGNIGFMGFPIISSMFGQEALILASIFVVLYNILIYSYGIMIIGSEKITLASFKKIINAGVIACIVEIIIFAFKIPVPDFLADTANMLSNTTAPVSMMIIGTTFVGLSFKQLFGNVRLLIFTALRMLVIPLLAYWPLSYFISDPILLGVSMVMLTVPVGSITVMVSHQYGGDVKTASEGVALTTALAVVTMPLIFAILF